MIGCEYMLLKYVPNPAREEHVNLGLILFESGTDNFEIRFAKNFRRVLCLNSDVDLEYLQAIQEDFQSKLSDVREREELLRLLHNDLEGNLQVGKQGSLRATSLMEGVEELALTHLESAAPISATPKLVERGRLGIIHQMEHWFEHTSVLPLLDRRFPASRYLVSDPLQFDFHYRVHSTSKLFHAVSLSGTTDGAKALAYSYTKIKPKMKERDGAEAMLTAVFETELDRNSRTVAFALEAFADAQILVSPVSEMPTIAETARRELLG